MAAGCAAAIYSADVKFTNEEGGVFADPFVPGVFGCERVRLFILPSAALDVRIDKVVIETQGCPPGQWKDETSGVCIKYEPGFYCSTTPCKANDPCGTHIALALLPCLLACLPASRPRSRAIRRSFRCFEELTAIVVTCIHRWRAVLLPWV